MSEELQKENGTKHAELFVDARSLGKAAGAWRELGLQARGKHY